MASVLFSTVGQALGGPLGAGIGAALGANVDRTLFRGRRRGAEDGFASRSAYGEIVPRVFGRTRVSGLLIWATAPTSGGAKGQGRTAQSAGFALAVSRGPIAGIGRIWADGSLLRTEDGRFLTPASLRVHSQGVAQADPLIVAVEGNEGAPAFPHLSYVVFENFDLGPYGNRIPSLSFEVLALGGTASEWLADLLSPLGVRLDAPSTGVEVDGYSARLDPLEADVADLLGASGCKIGLYEGEFRIFQEPRAVAIVAGDLVDDRAEPDTESMVRQDSKPAGLSLSFQDRDRDFQLGWQQEIRTGRGPTIALSWPLAAAAPVARAIAQRLLQEADAGAETIGITLTHRFLGISVGDAVSLPDGTIWQVTRREVRGLMVELEGRRLPRRFARLPIATEPGRILPAPDASPPASVVAVVEPPVSLRQSPGAELLVVASGRAGWQGADVRLLVGGDELNFGRASEQLPFGVLAEGLAGSPETIWDERNHVLVDVSAGHGLFLSRTNADVLNGGGLVSVGGEILQYRQSEAVEPGRVRLSGLLRGCFGTLPADATVGAFVISIPRSGGAWLPVGPDMRGRTLDILVDGAGDPPGGSLTAYTVQGARVSPLAPVHLRARRLLDGAVLCSWICRNRSNWGFSEGQPAPTELGVGGYAWHFRSGSGLEWIVAASPTGVRVEMASQVERFGGPMPGGAFRVEALGDGPERLRFSRWVGI
jgi:hypothetical protein